MKFNTLLLKGKYSIRWNAKDFSSGIYFITIKNVNNAKKWIQKETHKVTLIK